MGAAKKIVSGAGKVVSSVGKAIGGAVESYGKAVERVYHDLGNDPINGAIELAGLAYGGPVGASLAEKAVDTGKGKESVGQLARDVGSQFVGQKVGSAVGGEVGNATGSRVAGSAAGGFAGGTTAGVIQGKSGTDALKQGLGAGLASGATSATLGPSDGSTTDSIERALANSAFSQQFNDLLGLSRSSKQSPFSAIASRFTQPTANSSAAEAGPASVTGGQIDISGSDANAPRSNVWNRDSLRTKDALGA